MATVTLPPDAEEEEEEEEEGGGWAELRLRIKEIINKKLPICLIRVPQNPGI